MIGRLMQLSCVNAFAQLLNFFGIAYVSSRVGPGVYGEYSYILGIAMLFSAVMTLKGDNLIYAAEDEVEAWRMLCALLSSVIYQSATLGVVGVLLLCFYDANFFMVFAAGVAVAAANSLFIILNSFLVKSDSLRLYSATVPARPAGIIGLQLISISVFVSSLWLAICRFIFDLVVATLRFFFLGKSMPHILKIKDFYGFILVNYNFCVLGTFASAVNILNQQVFLLMMPFSYGFRDVGELGLALSLVVAPIAVIVSPFRGLMIKRFGRLEGIDGALIIKITLGVAFLCLLSYSLLVLFIPSFVSFLWGDEWPNLSILVTILLLWPLSSLISTPSYALIIKTSNQKMLLKAEIIALFARLLAVIYCLLFDLSLLMLAVNAAAIGVFYNFSLLFLGGKIYADLKSKLT